MNKEEEIIRETFNRLLLPQTEIAIMKGYGSAYTPENIEAACNRFRVMVEDKLRAKGYTKQEEIKKEEEKQKSYVPTLKPEPMLPMKRAGFADALILTIIVLVYAAIIINLILKLK